MESLEESGDSLNHVIKSISAQQLVMILQRIEGQKDLILENEITSILDQIMNFKTLNAAGVARVFKLEASHSPGETERCVYLVRPTLEATLLISNQIEIDRKMQKKLRKYWIIYVPKKLQMCEVLLEEEGTFEYVEIFEFPLGLVPIDTDLFSLEAPQFFPSFFVDDDLSWLPTIASSLIQFQNLCGPFENIYGKGNCAKMVHDIFSRMKRGAKHPNTEPSIGNLILIDRDSDYVSLLLTQMTFEGLIDETFGIKCGKAQFDKDVTGSEKPVKLPLNSYDKEYHEIRDKHFSIVLSMLKEKADLLKDKHSERKDMQINDLKKFVTSELKEVKEKHRTLSLLVGASEVIVKQKIEEFSQLLSTERALLEGFESKECYNYIEELIIKQEPIWSSLRLLCLFSITQEGLTINDYRTLITQFLQSYGHEFLVTIHSLRKLGLLMEQSQSSVAAPLGSNTTANAIAGKLMAAVQIRRNAFTQNLKRLDLVRENQEAFDYRYPPNGSYVFSGTYIPLIAAIAEQIIQHKNAGWTKMSESLKQTPGEVFHFQEKISRPISSGLLLEDKSSKRFLVYFLGGVTFAEIAALRFIGKQTGCEFFVATTAMISCKTLFENFYPATKN